MSNIIDKIRVSGTVYTLSATSSGGSPTVELTQAEYDALVSAGTVSADTYYIITDAQAGDLTQYWTSAQTQSAITQATSGLQETLSAGTGIDITDNVISTTGGGGITSGEVQSMIDESISGKTDESAFTVHTADTTIHVSSSEKNTWNNKSDFSGSYNDLTDKPTIPTSVSQLTNDSGYITSGDAQTQIDNSISGKVDTTTFNTYSGNVETSLSGKQDTLSAGTGISISGNVISATGGGGMTEDDELLLSTALTDLNDRKIDASEVKSNYQKKGDYATKTYVTTALEPYETKLDEINTEEVTAYALNDLNDRFGGLRIVKITESEYAALTTKDENTLYVVITDPT